MLLPRPDQPRKQMKYNKDKVDEMTLALMYLVMSETDEGGGAWAWKGFGWETLERLHRKGLIRDLKNKTKSVGLTEEGFKRSEELFLRHFASDKQIHDQEELNSSPPGQAAQSEPIDRRDMSKVEETIAAAIATGKQIIKDEHDFFVSDGIDNSEHIPRIARAAESVRRLLSQAGVPESEAQRAWHTLIDFGRRLFVEEWMKPLDGDVRSPSEVEAVRTFNRLLGTTTR